MWGMLNADSTSNAEISAPEQNPAEARISSYALARHLQYEYAWMRRMAGEMRTAGVARADILIQPFIDKYKNLRLEARQSVADPCERHAAHDQIVADVRAIGHRLKRQGLKGINYHNGFCRAVAALGEAYGYRGFNECGAEYELDGRVDGRVDAVWAHERRPVVLFEIDSTVKHASVQKLLTCEAAHRYWIYFGDDLWRLRTDLAKWDAKKEIAAITIPVAWKPGESTR